MILGCGRSGTSILGELFKDLPGYAYYSEPNYATLLELDYVSSIAVKVPQESPGYPATPGLSFPLDHWLRHVPGLVHIYWQVRHPLDTICSLRIGIAQNWGHHPRPPDWQDWLDRPLLERCAYHWAYLNTAGFAPVRHLANILRFEDMIQDPYGLAEHICRDVGLDPAACTEALQAWANRVQNTNNKDFVEAETSKPYSRPDHTVRVGRWQENLTSADVEQVRSLIAEAADAMGYLIV